MKEYLILRSTPVENHGRRCCLAQIFVMLGVILLKINFEAQNEFYNFSEDEIDTVRVRRGGYSAGAPWIHASQVLICVVCAPVAALLIPATYKAIMKRVKGRREAESGVERCLSTPVEELFHLGQRQQKAPEAPGGAHPLLLSNTESASLVGSESKEDAV